MEYKAFRQKWLIAIRKNDKCKYTPINKLNKFIYRKWIKNKANEEYAKYVINNNKLTKVTFNDQIQIKEFDKELPSNQ
jgi:hypothetical protein